MAAAGPPVAVQEASLGTSGSGQFEAGSLRVGGVCGGALEGRALVKGALTPHLFAFLVRIHVRPGFR